jgi:hypothetical protein
MRWIAPTILTILALVSAPVSGAEKSRKNDKPRMSPLQQAMRWLEEKRFNLAERSALTALRGKPSKKKNRAWLIVAMARKARGQYHRAVDAYDRYLKQAPKGVEKEFAASQKQQCIEMSDYEGRNPYDRIEPKQQIGLSRIDRKPVVIKSAHFMIRARNELLAEFVAKQSEVELKRLLRLLPLGKLKIRDLIEIHIWPDEGRFKAATDDNGTEHSGGLFSPHEGRKSRSRIDLMQLDEKGKLWETTLNHVLPHEICHILLHKFIDNIKPGGGYPLPLAINEGLAMSCEHDVDNQRLLLAGTAAEGHNGTPGLNRLLSIKSYSEIEDMPLFYAESFSFVQFLRERLSFQQLEVMLRQLGRGADFETALRRALLLPDSEGLMEKLDKAWSDYAVFQKRIFESICE